MPRVKESSAARRLARRWLSASRRKRMRRPVSMSERPDTEQVVRRNHIEIQRAGEPHPRTGASDPSFGRFHRRLLPPVAPNIFESQCFSTAFPLHLRQPRRSVRHRNHPCAARRSRCASDESLAAVRAPSPCASRTRRAMRPGRSPAARLPHPTLRSHHLRECSAMGGNRPEVAHRTRSPGSRGGTHGSRPAKPLADYLCRRWCDQG